MASIYRNGSKWRAQVYTNGVRDSKSLPTRQEAAQWALQREGELSGRKLPDKSLIDALRIYAKDVTPSHRGSRWEYVRLKSLEREKIGKRKVAGLAAEDWEKWRDDRLRQVKPGTVARELNLLRSVHEYARKKKWILINPFDDVKWPPKTPGRKRRISVDEIKTITFAFGLANGLRATTATQRVGLAFLFAIETAMRSGEICALTWERVHLADRYVALGITKNGDSRDVPLSTQAVAILRALPEEDGPVFGLDGDLRDALWRKTKPRQILNLRFHDSRAEAIWRLSKKLDVLQLARVVGHNDLKSLMIYYNETAAELALRLG